MGCAPEKFPLVSNLHTQPCRAGLSVSNRLTQHLAHLLTQLRAAGKGIGRIAQLQEIFHAHLHAVQGMGVAKDIELVISHGGKHLADKLGVPLLGQLPLSLPVREAMDAGTVKQMQEAQPAIAEIYTHAAWALALAVADKGKDFSSRFPKIVVE